MYRQAASMESPTSKESQVQTDQQSLPEKGRIFKAETKQLQMTKPHFDPWLISQHLLVMDEVNSMIGDLCLAHGELQALNPTQVNQYGSSSWVKLLKKTPPAST